VAETKETAVIILATAISRFLTVVVCASLASFYSAEKWPALYYYPAAAIDIITLIALGYPAAIGVTIGCLVWNWAMLDMSLLEQLKFVLLALGRGVVSLWLFLRFVAPELRVGWTALSLRHILLFTAIYSAVNAVGYLALFQSHNLSHGETLRQGLGLFVGAAAGGLTGFVALNLGFSAALSRRLKKDE